MNVKNYSNYKNYSRLYEAKLNECPFLLRENITADDIISPLEGLITEEFIKKMISSLRKGASNVANKVKGVYQDVKTAVTNLFSGVVKFFQNFSFKKLISAIYTKIKEIGTGVFKKIKEYLSSMNSFILSNNMVDPETGKPIFKNIWSTICNKAKSVINTPETGMDDAQLQSIGSKVKLNEADKFDISDDEVKYYGFFSKVAHAMGIKNARFNGVVSQILQKGTIGIAIMSIMSLCGFPGIAALTITNPVALAAIGGMLLMAGLIILAIWICKPYPTVDDCLAYLHMHFGGKLQQVNIITIFLNPYPVPTGGGIRPVPTGGGIPGGLQIGTKKPLPEIVKEKKPVSEKSVYPLMIRNLECLRLILLNNENVKLDGEKGTKSDIVSGRLYNYTSKAGKKSIVKVISVTHDTQIGKDKDWLTKDDKKVDTLQKGYTSVIYPDKDGKYTNKSKEMAVKTSQLQPLRESILSFSELILEKDRLGKGANVEINKDEDYLTQSTLNLRKSIKSLQDEKDKGVAINVRFLEEILGEKMDAETKQPVKDLFKEIYEYLYGNKSKTLPAFGDLYKESVDIISKARSRQVVAEKIARFAKRSMQFEGEGFYSGLGKLGDYLEEYNTTLKQIMDYNKYQVSESVMNFESYKKF
jgi:hypothetical protein